MPDHSKSCSSVAETPFKFSLLQELRQKTAPQHRALEQNSYSWKCLSSRDGYAHLLVKLFAIHSAFENRLATVETLPFWLPDISERWKLAFLKSDLAALSVPEPHMTFQDLPVISSVASAFGCLYVLEGSTLGGQIITRHLQSQLGMVAEDGRRFFAGYGARTGHYWKTFGDKLAAYSSASGPSHAEVIQSAIHTFHYFSQWLTEKDL
jgi:heme oxygenase